MKYIQGKNYQVTKSELVTLPFYIPLVSTIECGGGLVQISPAPFSKVSLSISKGWTWDGASFFLFRWFGTPDRWLLYSLYHDALYEFIRRGLLGREYREQVDRMFRNGLIERGVNKWEAQIAYWCIRVGGNFAVRKDVVEREVL